MTVEDPGSSQPSSGPATRPETRKITDAQTMRALAHPVRIALLEELVLGGALTATELAASVLSRLVHERQLDRYRAWLESRGTYPREWRDAANDSEYLYYVTPAELKELSQEMTDLLMSKYQDRLLDPALRPAGSAPVELLTFSFPIRLPAAEDEPGSGSESGSGGEPGSGGAQ